MAIIRPHRCFYSRFRKSYQERVTGSFEFFYQNNVEQFDKSAESKNDMYKNSSAESQVTVEKATTHDYAIGQIFCSDSSHYCFMDNNTVILIFHQAHVISIKPMK